MTLRSRHCGLAATSGLIPLPGPRTAAAKYLVKRAGPRAINPDIPVFSEQAVERLCPHDLGIAALPLATSSSRSPATAHGPRKTPGVHYCIMRRLSRLSARMPDPRLIMLIQRFPTTTVWQRASPANTHYEMLASLDFFTAERFCRQQNLAQWSRCSWLNNSRSCARP